MITLPKRFEPFTDKYFLRSLEILQKENLNPFVRAQVFIRKGPGKIAGIQEACAVLEKFSALKKNGGRVFALPEGSPYDPRETLMIIEGRAQDIIPLETMLVGVISAETSKANGIRAVDLDAVSKRVKKIVSLIGERPLVYFGARHWRYDEDAAIAKAAFSGGASDASTDIGAKAFGKTGVGTIPHSIECIYAWKFGLENAVVETVKAFDRVIDPAVNRVALIDFANREVDDSLACARVLQKKLFGVRVDTAGENIMQRAKSIKNLDAKGDKGDIGDNAFWFGTGVSISGVYALRKALDENGFANVKIMLTSGFGNSQKVQAFVDAEKELGVRLFDSLGVGEFFESRAATMDIVGVGENFEGIKPVSKVGRGYRPNPRLREVS